MEARKILFVAQSNFGDAVLSLPLLDCLRARFPLAAITVMIGPRARLACEHNPAIDRMIIYDKYAPLRTKARLFFELSRERYDIVIDLRNSLYGALLPARRRTSPFVRVPSARRHMRDRNLYRLYRALGEEVPVPAGSPSFAFDAAESAACDAFFAHRGLSLRAPYVVVNPCANGPAKFWETERFIELCALLSQRCQVVVTGGQAHKERAGIIARGCSSGVLDLSGATTMRQMAYLLKRAAVVVTVDTGVNHLASYMNAPLVVLFGDSDERRYGPWSDRAVVVKKDMPCRPCSKGECRFKTLRCMKDITVSDVFGAVEDVLKGDTNGLQDQ